MSEDPDIVLSEWERERLAGIEEGLAADVRLAARLAGTGTAVAWSWTAAAALVVLGGVVAVATFIDSVWLASAGLAAMGAGMFAGAPRAAAWVTASISRIHPPGRREGEGRPTAA